MSGSAKIGGVDQSVSGQVEMEDEHVVAAARPAGASSISVVEGVGQREVTRPGPAGQVLSANIFSCPADHRNPLTLLVKDIAAGPVVNANQLLSLNPQGINVPRKRLIVFSRLERYLSYQPWLFLEAMRRYIHQ
jgi:hypothetical protein